MLDREYLEEMFREIEDEILCNNIETRRINEKTKLLTQLTGNTEKVNKLLDSSTGLYSIVITKKREFFFEAINMFVSFQDIHGFPRDTAMVGLLEALEEIEKKTVYGDEEYLAENDKHNKEVVAFQKTLSKGENQILLEILNIDADMYELHSNILFEVMLILAQMLNRMGYVKK